MKLHIVTVGKPKLAYAQAGFAEYTKRLGRFHTVRVTHLADKHADDAAAMQQAIGQAYLVALVIQDGRQFSSEGLAAFLEQRAQEGREVCCIIGGPEGLPADIINAAQTRWSFSELTFPHDLAMLILAEALYRASTIASGHPYHRG